MEHHCNHYRKLKSEIWTFVVELTKMKKSFTSHGPARNTYFELNHVFVLHAYSKTVLHLTCSRTKAKELFCKCETTVYSRKRQNRDPRQDVQGKRWALQLLLHLLIVLQSHQYQPDFWADALTQFAEVFVASSLRSLRSRGLPLPAHYSFWSLIWKGSSNCQFPVCNTKLASDKMLN